MAESSSGAYRGHFTLEELLALGQSGDARKDWLSGGAGRTALNPKLKFPAGYYRLPGSASEAVYVDPKSGSVPFQFYDMLDKSTGDLKRDSISGLPTAYLQDNSVWQEPGFFKQIREGLAEQQKQESLGLSPQEAQDRRFGSRPVVGADDTYKPGIHNSVGSPSGSEMGQKTGTAIGSAKGAYDKFIKAGGTDDLLKMPAFRGYDSERIKNLKDSFAHGFLERYRAQSGLGDLRESQGLDRATGTSTAEKERLRSTYEALDPAKRSSWLFYQDPGNLTPELRELRAESRRGERELIANANQYAHDYTSFQSGGKTYRAVIKRGDVSQTEIGTGREKFQGNVPLKAELIKGKYDRIGDFGRRVGGGLAGGFLGFFGGGALGAFAGAYQGAGGPAPVKGGVAGGIYGGLMGYATGGGAGAALGGYAGAGGAQGLRNAQGGGFSNWRGSAGQIPGAAQMGSAIAFAKFAGPKAGPHPAGTTGRTAPMRPTA